MTRQRAIDRVARLGVLAASFAWCACTTDPERPDAAAGSSSAGASSAGASSAGASSAGASSAGASSAGSGGAAAAAGQAGANSGGASGSAGATAGGPPTSQGGSGGNGAGGAAGFGGTGGTGGTGGEVTGCRWDVTAGRVALFDGANLDQWQSLAGGAAPWKLSSSDQSFEVVPGTGNIRTKLTFEDLCLHIEYLTPTYPPSVTGQERGNSGIYLKSAYELQVLDSVGQPAANNTCGAVYGIQAPLVVACTPELTWNVYEIEFEASEWTDGKKSKNAVVRRATLNGQLVQQNVDLNPASGATQAGEPDVAGPRPLMLQDHNNNVKFRNIWARVPK